MFFFFVLYITKYNTNYKCLARYIWIINNDRKRTHCLIIKINLVLLLMPLLPLPLPLLPLPLPPQKHQNIPPVVLLRL